jgi:hypothetical protein
MGRPPGGNQMQQPYMNAPNRRLSNQNVGFPEPAISRFPSNSISDQKDGPAARYGTWYADADAGYADGHAARTMG